MELAPRGRAMLEILQTMERAVEMHREKLGVRTADLFSVPT
jgi:hypothetical protein